MNIADVTARLDAIRAKAADDEAAHSEEDALYFDLLAAIGRGDCEDPAACAREAVKAAEIDFCRWYA